MIVVNVTFFMVKKALFVVCPVFARFLVKSALHLVPQIRYFNEP